MSGGAWKPIASAPRNGKWFAICRAGEPESVEVGCFDPQMWMGFELADAARGLYRKVSKPVNDWRGFDNFHHATHWTALPDVPQAVE